MVRTAHFFWVALLAAPWTLNGLHAEEPCQKCEPVQISVQTDIDFGRIVIVGDGDGRVILDLASGNKTAIGELDDLGGLAVQGEALVTGKPGENVRVTLPNRVTMRAPDGGEAELQEIITDLPALARLDSYGQLRFKFSGTMVTSPKAALGGKLRGRINIRVEYD